MKEDLIKKLLDANPQDKLGKKAAGSTLLKPEAKEVEYEGKYDPKNPENEADFKKAYSKLISKIASSQGKEEPQLLVTENDIKKIEEEKQKAENAKGFQDRVQNHTEKIKKKRDLVKEELEEKEMRECTFAPKTLRKTEKRRLEDFLKDQQRHLEKKQENINKLVKDNQEKEELSIASLPKINEHSRIMTEVKKEQSSKPVHERLFAKSKKPITSNEDEQTKPEEKKATRKKDGVPRQFTLYEEAKKRQDKWLEKQKTEAEGLKAKPLKEYSRDPYVQQKFVKEFNAVLNEIAPGDNTKPLSYEQMSNLSSPFHHYHHHRGATHTNVLHKASISCGSRTEGRAYGLVRKSMADIGRR